MTADEIRQRFLDFFASKGHRVVPSDSLVPKDDPTVLFTTAGMQQFKRQFLGYVGDYSRAASSQKCLRTDDLDKVGKTDFHHTFFEMLGNFSFGDYFKKDAIAWAWEFLTRELKIPAEKLWVSVYKEDEEAEKIWLSGIRLSPARLVRLGDHSNFWPADAKEKGPNGPCGPCSEIFYDYGVNPQCTRKTCDPSCSCGRFSEVWNLVFTQFDRREGGVLEPLPNKNIDTGMGLERLVAVVQGKKSNYETDLFKPLILKIEASVVGNLFAQNPVDKLKVADHIRAIVFAIADGVIPTNEGRGYVVKRLIYDSANLMAKNNAPDLVLHKLIPVVVDIMGAAYPELISKMNDICATVKPFEEAALRIRNEKIPKLQTEVTALKSRIRTDDLYNHLGELAFLYHDTHGLTPATIMVQMTQVGAFNEDQINKIWHFYNESLKEQQKRSRAASKMTGDVFVDTELEVDLPKTDFRGYEHTHSRSTILRLFIGARKVHEAGSGDHVQVVLDKTPFYAEAGGQIGDTGYIQAPAGKIRVTDTQKINDVYIHTGTVEEGLVKVGEYAKARIDVERRLAIMRHHTATHLLQAALREVLGRHVQQQGSLVAEDRLRFDFTHPKAITLDEMERIEDCVNDYILRCDPVTKEELPIQTAKESGALAFFAEKYGEKVRVVTIGGYSKEFCGGTHLNSTGQIGLLKITAEGAVAQGIRRIEAKAGKEAFAFVHAQEKQLEEAALLLRSSKDELIPRLSAQTRQLKQMEKDIEKYQLEAAQNSVDTIIAEAQVINGARIVSHSFKGLEIGILRQVCDRIKQKTKSSVIVLGSCAGENASIVLAVTDDLIQKGVKADEMIQEIAPVIGGSGGGRPHLAQAGSKQTDKVEEAIRRAHQIIKGKLAP